MAVMGRLVNSVVLVLLLASLVACTRPDAAIVALAVRDGRPTGVLVTCDAAISQLHVFQNDAKEQPSPDTPLVWWGVHGVPAAEVIEVALLGPLLPGWEVDDDSDVTGSERQGRAKIEPLTEFRPGVRYGLGGSSPRYALTVDFTTADFARIGTDDVLAPVRRDMMKVMSRDDFVRTARDACD